MKDLLDNIITFLNTAKDDGDLQVEDIRKGLNQNEQLIAFDKYPYVYIDDGGERTELNDSHDAQTRFYTVLVEIGVFTMDFEDSVDAILDRYNELQLVFEDPTNRQKDGLVFGRTVQVYQWEEEDKFFRARQVAIEYRELDFVDLSY